MSVAERIDRDFDIKRSKIKGREGNSAGSALDYLFCYALVFKLENIVVAFLYGSVRGLKRRDELYSGVGKLYYLGGENEFDTVIAYRFVGVSLTSVGLFGQERSVGIKNSVAVKLSKGKISFA